MITTILLTIITFFFLGLSAVLPSYSIWPTDLLTGLNYFATTIAKLNFLFPIQSFFAVFTFILVFESFMLVYKIITSIIKFARGSNTNQDVI